MRTFAIASGKGGVGKTTLAANLGCAMARNNWRALLFDADLTLANLDVVFGVNPEFTLQSVLSGDKTLKEIITPGSFDVGLIAGGSAVGNLMRTGKKRIGRFLAQISDIENDYDALIFDLSAGLDNKVITFCRVVDEVIALTTPDPAAVLDVYALAKIIFRYRPEAFIRVVVNNVETETEAKSVFAKLNSAARQFLGKELSYGGSIRHDLAAAESVRRRTPFVFAYPTLPASQDVIAIADGIMKTQESAADGSFSNRLSQVVELPQAA